MYSIYKKELNQYFKTTTGYIFIAAFLVISGVYFFINNLMVQSGDIKVFAYSLNNVLIFLIPMLTMRLFSEEKRHGTDQLLLTAPVSITDIIVGKFLSTMTVYLIPLGITSIYAVIIAIYGNLNILEMIGSYLGIILMSGTFVAIGLFVSVLSESQIVACVLTYAVTIILTLMGSIASFTNNVIWKTLFEFLSITKHSNSFFYGIISLKDIMYYSSNIFLFLFLCIYALERKRVE